MQQNTFRNILQQVYRENHFLRFDEFIVRKFVDVSVEEPMEEEVRRIAFRKFQEATGQEEIASVVTMRRWFGLSGYAKPNRMHIYQIAFALRLGKEETEEYLTRGLGEPSFQISDYHEMIYLYGIENHLLFEKCQQMVQMFEKNLMVNQTLSVTRSTEQLRQRYEEHKNLPVEDFLLFMSDNTMYFKGYSNTALSYLLEYRNQVLRYIRQDAVRQLEQWLAETDYEEWRRKQWLSNQKDPYRMIQKYIKSRQNGMLSEMVIENIKELSKLAYSTLQNNSLVHSELFYDQPGNRSKSKHSDVRNMTMKHLSDLLNVANQKECAVKVIAAFSKLENLHEEERCPEDVQDLLRKLTRQEDGRWNCKEARQWLLEYDKEHKRRQLVVQRGDLLPFVLYVSQQKYLDEMEEKNKSYDAEDARSLFRQAADDVLTACNMLPLRKERELDAVLLACYQEDEMYGYPDVLEALYG